MRPTPLRKSLIVVLAALVAACAGSGGARDRRLDPTPIDVTVLATAGCGQTDAATLQVTNVAARLGVLIRVEHRLVETEADAVRLHLLGSPTILIAARDIDPSARERTDYGFT